MGRKYRKLLVLWEQVVEAHGKTVSDAVCMQMTLDLYNMDHNNDEADLSDLIDALEHSGD